MMKLLLIDTLEKLGYPVLLQGSMASDAAYPDSFITFFTNDSPDIGYYDNTPVGTAWDFQVAFYSNDPLLVEREAKRIRKELLAVGFIAYGRGRDIPSDEPTHTGWVNDYTYLEMEE